MVQLVDEALVSPNLFGVSNGLAAANVTVADPAVGSGTFLLDLMSLWRSRVARL